MKDRDARNVCIAIEKNKFIQDGAQLIKVNDIRFIHGRKVKNIIFPLLNNYTLKWVDKKKGIKWISSVIPNETQDISAKNLSSATNIIENFENPTLKQGEITSAVEELSETLHTPVRLVRNTAIEDSDNQSSMKRKNKAWFDPITQEVYINLDNTVDAEDAQRSYLHEVVGHYGLRELLGEDFENSMFDMFEMLPKEKKDEIGRYMQKNYGRQLASMESARDAVVFSMEEWLSKEAEENPSATWWEKVCGGFKRMLRSFGIKLNLTDNDIRYLLWRSKNNLNKGVFEKSRAPRAQEIRYRVEDSGPEVRMEDLEGLNDEEMIDVASTIVDLNDSVRNDFLKRVKSLRFREAWQDRMITVKAFQELIKPCGTPRQKCRRELQKKKRYKPIKTIQG